MTDTSGVDLETNGGSKQLSITTTNMSPGRTPSAGVGTAVKVLLGCILIGVIVAIGVGAATFAVVYGGTSHHPYHFDVRHQEFASSRRPPGFEGKSWEDVLAMARGQTVNFWMWSGRADINTWVDGFLTTKLSTLFGVKLTRVPKGALAAVAQVKAEMEEGNTEKGTCDLVWINGANFKNLKTGAKGVSHAYGPFAMSVPNAANFNFGSIVVAEDHGTPTEGYAMPYNTAQSVFIYNTAHVTSPPTDIPAFTLWIKNNPGRFTYSNPTKDFIGSVIMRHFFYHYAGGPDVFSGELTEANEAAYVEKSKLAWDALNAIEPYLYKSASNVIYPDAHSTVEQLFNASEIWLEGAYDPNKAGAFILQNNWPATAQSYVLTTGSIANTNYVAIPVNSPSKAAAMVAANYIGQLEAMFSRTDPKGWGAFQAYDPSIPHIVHSGWNTAFDYIDRHHSTPTVEELAARRLGELSSSYVTRIEADWEKFVLNA